MFALDQLTGAAPVMTQNGVVFVVDGDPSEADAVCELVERMGLTVHRTASVEDALESWDWSRPCCLIGSLSDLTNAGEPPETRIGEETQQQTFVVSGHVMRLLRKALSEGAIQPVDRPYTGFDLTNAISRAVATDSEHYERTRRIQDTERRLETLTPAEHDVLDLILAGASNKVIAAQLHVSTRTIDRRRSDLLAKMDAKTVAELILKVSEARMPNPSGTQE